MRSPASSLRLVSAADVGGCGERGRGCSTCEGIPDGLLTLIGSMGLNAEGQGLHLRACGALCMEREHALDGGRGPPGRRGGRVEAEGEAGERRELHEGRAAVGEGGRRRRAGPGGGGVGEPELEVEAAEVGEAVGKVRVGEGDVSGTEGEVGDGGVACDGMHEQEERALGIFGALRGGGGGVGRQGGFGAQRGGDCG